MKKISVCLFIFGVFLVLVGNVLANSKEDVYRAAVAVISDDPTYSSFGRALDAFKAEIDLYEATPGADMMFVESMKNVLAFLSKARIYGIMFIQTNAVRPKEAREYIEKIYGNKRQAQIHLDIAKRRLKQ